MSAPTPGPRGPAGSPRAGRAEIASAQRCLGPAAPHPESFRFRAGRGLRDHRHLMTLEPSRIILARRRAGLPKTALARAAGVAPRTVTTWESKGAPSARLSDIAGATGMPAEFFSGGAIDLLEEDRIFFRARRRSPSALLHRSAAFGSLGIGFYDSIRRRFRTPALSMPEAEPDDSPRQAARALRLAWRMGMGPAPNLVQLAEAHGIRVLGIPLADAAVDAFSFWAPDGRPFVFLSRINGGALALRPGSRDRSPGAPLRRHWNRGDHRPGDRARGRCLRRRAPPAHRGPARPRPRRALHRGPHEDQEHLRGLGHGGRALDPRHRPPVGVGPSPAGGDAHVTRIPHG